MSVKTWSEAVGAANANAAGVRKVGLTATTTYYRHGGRLVQDSIRVVVSWRDGSGTTHDSPEDLLAECAAWEEV